MNIDELAQLLSQRENCEIEYKTAKGGFPSKAFWPTYSSFGNTNGGVVVLGVKEVDGKPQIEEQYDPDRVRMVMKFTRQSPSGHQAVTKFNEADSLSWNQVATKLPPSCH